MTQDASLTVLGANRLASRELNLIKPMATNMIRFIFLSTISLFISVAAFAQTTVFSPFNSERQNRFACQISTNINEYLISHRLTYQGELEKIRSILTGEISNWASVLGFDQPIIRRSNILFSDYDYLLQNAFIDIGRINVDQLPDENWFAAYTFLSAKLETQYRLGEIGAYNLSADPTLREQIRDYLDQTKNLNWPNFLDEDGRPKRATYNCRPSTDRRYTTMCSVADTSPLGDPDHPQYSRWIREAQSANLIASPLFHWILLQPNNSISYESLFEQAVAEYKNPFVALGVITWMFMVDAQMGSRQRGALLSKRIQRIAYTSDIAGDNYHFWGFFLKALNGQGFRYRIMSFVHERIIQRDTSDWLIDNMALSFGNLVRDRIRRPSLCAQNTN